MNTNSENSVTFECVVQQLQHGNSMPAELLDVFSEEAAEHLQTIYDGLGRLAIDSTDRQALADVRRASHTLKGATGAVDLKTATQLAHRMEDLLDRLAENFKSVSEPQLKLLLETTDQLQELTAGAFEGEPAARRIVQIYDAYDCELGTSTKDSIQVDPVETSVTMDSSEPVSDAKTSVKSAAGSNGSTQYLRVPVKRLNEMVSLLGEMVVTRTEFEHRIEDFESRIEDMHNALERLRSLSQYSGLEHGDNNTNSRAVGVLSRKSSPALQGGQDDFDPLEMEQYSESYLFSQNILEADNDAEMMSREFRKLKSVFSGLLRRQQQLNRDAQKSLMRIRMVPLSGILNRIQRTVRTVSAKVEKQVRLEIIGEHTELDKTVLDEIVDPLLHLIRNAIDHGVESTESRIAVGKHEMATITLSALNEGTQINLCISDDGGGIDRERVLQKAIQSGLIDGTTELPDEEVLGLIFRPGFSTASQLTDVSGRGVGMDVVANAVRRLKGSVHVESHVGEGTTFKIQLPATLGVSRALFTETCGRKFAIPMASIEGISKLDPGAIQRDCEHFYVSLDGEKHRLVVLEKHLRLTSLGKDYSFDRPVPMLKLTNGVESVAIVVDRIDGSKDIAIKPLGDHLKNVPGINGATIGGDGIVIPILDTAELFSTTKIGLVSGNEEFNPAVVIRQNLVMVVDDSISVRKITQKRLSQAGWDVVTAQDGVDALEKLSRMDTPPDVFLCDMEMPRMDGIELMRQIRRQSKFETTPVVMVTSRASEKHRHKAFEAGATEYVLKPYNDENLLALITKLVESDREIVTN